MALSTYLKVPGIVGGSTDPGHAGSIDILAWSWGMTNSGTAVSGPGKGSWQDMSLTAWVDNATSALMLSAMRGNRFDTATLSTVYSSPSTQVDKYAMSNVFVSSISVGGSGGEDRFTINFGLSFSAVAAMIALRQWKWDLTTNTGG